MPRKQKRSIPVQGDVGHQTNYRATSYKDGAPVPDDPTKRRPCRRCGKPPTETGADPCIAGLPGVNYACCGHGGQGYVAYVDRRVFRFFNQPGEAIRQMAEAHIDDHDELPPGWAWDDPTRSA